LDRGNNKTELYTQLQQARTKGIRSNRRQVGNRLYELHTIPASAIYENTVAALR
jgi:hypothetical protein